MGWGLNSENDRLEKSIPVDKYTDEALAIFISQMFDHEPTAWNFEINVNDTGCLQFSGHGHLLIIHPVVADFFNIREQMTEEYMYAGSAYCMYVLDDPANYVVASKPFVLRSNIPEYIRILMDGVDSNYGSPNCVNTLAVLPTHHTQDELTFFADVSRREYIKLQSQEIASIHLKLVDESGQQLSLVRGQPTMIGMHFSVKEESDFVLRISSKDANMEGSNSDFRINFPSPIIVQHGTWKTALSSILFPTIFARLGNSGNIEHVNFVPADGGMTNELHLREEDFTSSEKLLQILNSVVGFARNEGVYFEQVRGHLNIVFGPGEEVTVVFPSKTAFLLGISNTFVEGVTYPIVSGDRYIAPQKIDLERLAPRALLLYVDIIKPQVVGSQYSKVIKMIPVARETSAGNMQSYESNHLDFVELTHTHIHSVSLKLVQSDGQLVTFHNNADEVLINLVFSQQK